MASSSPNVPTIPPNTLAMASSSPNVPTVSSPALGAPRASVTEPIPSTTRRGSLTPTTRSRASSITQSVLEANPPLGMWGATGHVLGRAPSIKDLREGSAQRRRRSSTSSSADGRIPSRGSSRSLRGLARRATEHVEERPALLGAGLATYTIAERKSEDARRSVELGGLEDEMLRKTACEQGAAVDEAADHGRRVPSPAAEADRPAKWDTTRHALRVFGVWVRTPLGACIAVYGLNVVAWGGMLFLLLCNAAPAMCVPDCNDINSPRRRWIEIDSQILNALFCVTGFGLAPWRFRDVYFLLSWRLRHNRDAFAKLASLHAGWFRPPPRAVDVEARPLAAGSVPADEVERDAAAEETATGEHASPTPSWKLDAVVWLYVWNTFLQAVLSGFMWGMSRYNRPSWSTGLFVALACIVAGLAGIISWRETARIKKIEGEKKKLLVEEKRPGMPRATNL